MNQRRNSARLPTGGIAGTAGPTVDGIDSSERRRAETKGSSDRRCGELRRAGISASSALRSAAFERPALAPNKRLPRHRH